MRPLSGTDPYLSGYLAVKALWTVAARKSRLLWDPDVFLGYVRSWFYDDPVFVSVLLSTTTTGIDSASAISEHLRERFNEFLSCDLDREAQMWLDSAVKPRSDILLPGLQRTREQFECTNNELAALLYEDKFNSDLDASLKAVIQFKEIIATTHRRFMVLGHFPVKIAKLKNGTVTISALTEPGLDMTITDNELPDTAEGRVFVIWDSQSMLLAVLAVVEQRVVPVKTIGDFKAEDLQAASNLARTYQQMAKLVDVLKAALDSATDTVAFQIMQRHLGSESARVAENMYSEIATLNTAQEARSEILRQLREKGLFTVLNHDGDLLRGLAAVGLANTISHARSNVELALNVCQLDEETIKHPLEAQTRHGMKLIVANEHTVTALV
jgi:hypothetical protein